MNIPIFIKIHDDLINRIDTGLYQSGQKLPSERDLAEEYKVSRMTVRQSLNRLVEEGVLERRVGDGTYVLEKTIIENLRGLTSFSQLMAQSGKTASTKFISFRKDKPDSQQASALGISLDDDVIILERLRLGDNEPIAYEIAALPYEIAGDIKRDDLFNSLYKAIENKGFRIDNASALQEFHARNADEKVAEILNILPGEAMLYLKQTSFFSNGKPFEFVRTYYVGSRYHVYLERKSID